MFDSIFLLMLMFFGLCFALVMYLYTLNDSKWLFAPESKLLAWLKARHIFDDYALDNHGHDGHRFKQHRFEQHRFEQHRFKQYKFEQATISDMHAHNILYELGETLESLELSRFAKIKNDIHPKVSEYYHRHQNSTQNSSQGMNVGVTKALKRSDLKLVR